jgi:hypothetical protein
VNVHRASFAKFAAIFEANLSKIRAVRNPSGTPTVKGSAAARAANVKIHANRKRALAAAEAGEAKPGSVTDLQWRKAKVDAKKGR